MYFTATSVGLIAGGVALIVFRQLFTTMNSMAQSLLRGEEYTSNERTVANYVSVVVGAILTAVGILALFGVF